MPRGQRKSLEEKIQAKQELINALNIRIESEERELEELYEQKRRKELEAAGLAAVAQTETAPLTPQEGADIMNLQTEKSMELRKDVRKFAEDNPEIAAQMVKSWLREGDGE